MKLNIYGMDEKNNIQKKEQKYTDITKELHPENGL